MASKDPESDKRAWKAIGLSVGAPIAAYLMIFQHLRCETAAEQFTAVLLMAGGLTAAIRWA